MGTHGCVASSHYLASNAGFEVLAAGGNAIDAAVAIGLALHVVEPHMNGIGGEAPILVYSAEEKKVFAISGQGTAPKAATVEYFHKRKIDLIPGDGFLPITVPASFGAWIACLTRFGTMTLGEVSQPAVRLAQEGFPVYEALQANIRQFSQRFLKEWVTSAQIFLPDGQVPEVGQILKQRDLARTLSRLVQAEKSAGGNREAGLKAARDLFYSGEIARKIIRFTTAHESSDASGKMHTALLALEDLAEYETRIEDPVSVDFAGLRIYKCGPWSQGPVFLQQLRLLDGYDLQSMGHNSADYIHLVTEASKLAFADREKYYGDPLFVDVPLENLLSENYAESRRGLIDLKKASLKLQPGEVSSSVHRGQKKASWGDTTHLDTVDSKGNMVSATPSGGWIWSSPVVKELGFPLGTRGQMFSLKEGHPNCLAPQKRPRTTLSPTLVTLEGKPLMAFGTPGGDQQDQWTLQFFLNFVAFGMNLQAAIDAPSFHNSHFPSSFYPRDAHPGRLHLEDRFPIETVKELRRRGHRILLEGPWSNGKVTAVHYDAQMKVVSAAASSRHQTPYALGR
jgi:gamma-glutamyltranspeptidase/glutathione hydrolase